MINRAIEYYLKNLKFDVRQEIYKKIDDIGNVAIKCFLEKNIGYTKYKRMGLSEEEILKQIELGKRRFELVNCLMIDNERNPLFSNPNDTYMSAQEYVDLLAKKTPEELLSKFGCTWEEYEPEVYQKPTKQGKETK